MARKVKGRTDLWEARRRLPNGKRPSFYGKSEQEAEDAADHAVKVAKGAIAIVVSEPGSIREFIRLNVWPGYSRKEPATFDQGKWAFNKYILPSIGELPCEQLQLYHCEMILGHVREGDVWEEKPNAKGELVGRWIPGTKERAGGTVNTVRKHLGRLTRLLARQRLISYNYIEEIELDESGHLEAVLTAQEAFSLWADNINQPIGPLIFLTALLGNSRGEALGRTVEDVGDVLLVRTQRVYEGEKKRARAEEPARKRAKDKATLKTDYRIREIPLPKAHQEILNRYADGRRHLCQTSRGPMFPTSARKMLLDACERAGLPPCTPQSLRATFMSVMDQIGCPRGILKEIVGHGDETVTDGYVSVLDDHPVRVWLRRYLEHASTLPGGTAGGTTSSLDARERAPI